MQKLFRKNNVYCGRPVRINFRENVIVSNLISKSAKYNEKEVI